MNYGLPVQVRDGVLGIKESAPKQEANREFFLANRAAQLDTNQKLLTDKIDPAAHSILTALSKRSNRDAIESNKPLPCSFFAKGQCLRGESCPFLHELVQQPPSTLKSFRDRYYGENDASAAHFEESAAALAVPFTPPEDRSVTAFHIAGLSGHERSEDLADHFEGLFADDNKKKVKHVKILENGTAAIVSFKSRSLAEEAAAKAIGLVTVCGQPVRVTWAQRPKLSSSVKYPSQDPERFGSK